MKIRTLFRASFLLLVSAQINAATLNLEDCGTTSKSDFMVSPDGTITNVITVIPFSCVKGIDDMTILGVNYDMTVENTTLNTLLSDPATQLLSWGNPAFANAASQEVANILNIEIPQASWYDTTFSDQLNGINILGIRLYHPVNFDLIFSVVNIFEGACNTIEINPGTSFSNNCRNTDQSPDRVFPFAVFKPSPVPVPAAIWLFGTALVGLVGFSKRRKAV